MLFSVVGGLLLGYLLIKAKRQPTGVAASSQPVGATPDRLDLLFGKLIADDTFFEFTAPVASGGFKVPRKLVQGATVEKVSYGKVTLKVFGAGSELAAVRNLLPNDADAAQQWLMERIAK